jgi:aminopeptidase
LREQEVKCINAEIIIYAPMLPPTYFEQMTVDRRALMARNNLSNEAARLRSQRQERGEYRSIYVLYPTPVFSDTLQISLENLERAVLKGALIDTNDDSIEAWQQLQVEAQAWQRWLKDRQEIHIVAQGTDLRCSIKDRSFFSHIGHSLLPGGQLLTVPHTDSWQGYITFNTTMFFGTQRLSHVFIRFDHGRVVELYAAEGADMLQRALQTDVGASIIGEFGIGLNSHLDSLIGTVPFDELVRGTVHIAFGKSYPGAGATNHSMLHLDLIADLRSNGTVSVDEEKILVGGILALPD